MPKPAPADRVPAHIRGLGKVHHVALIVGLIENALGLWRDQLGLELETVMDIGTDRVRIAFLTVGESKIELVEPTDDTTGVARFLASKGEGFHHVCFEVPNLAETLLRLEIDGLELIDTAPRKGAEGPVAFLHPRSCHGVLVELIEAPEGPAWRTLGYASADAPEPREEKRRTRS
jgi:methylmalonyl-CoA/ethylmalonyl-CoA epimerase